MTAAPAPRTASPSRATTTPDLSVVIPTHNRAASVRRTLEALAQQTYPAAHWEVVVVADGCADETVAMLHATASALPVRLRVHEQDGQGAGAARNAGAALASGATLVFLDDDMQPAPGFVAAHAAIHAGRPEQVALGPSWPVLPGRLDFFRIMLRAWWLDFFGALAQPGYRHTFRSLAAGNCSLPAAVFARLGGFDPAIRSSGGEDWEFGVRLIKADVPFAFAAKAQAQHHDETHLRRSLQRRRQEGQAEVVIGRRYPDLCPGLDLARIDTPPSRLDRRLRQLAFAAPATGDALARLSLALLDELERRRLRRPWRVLYGHLRDYWYWRGVADEVGSRAALAALLQGPAPADAGREIDVDLGAGLEAAEQRLDRERPAGVRLHVAGQPVGHLPAEPGAEPLRGVHLRSALATTLADRFLRVLAVQAATGASLSASWQPILSGASPSAGRQPVRSA